VRLAPYAEQLCLLPAGRLFEGVLVNAHFGADWAASPEPRRLLVSTAAEGQQRNRGACSSNEGSCCTQRCASRDRMTSAHSCQGVM
jgi:hypothetical protein